MSVYSSTLCFSFSSFFASSVRGCERPFGPASRSQPGSTVLAHIPGRAAGRVVPARRARRRLHGRAQPREPSMRSAGENKPKKAGRPLTSAVVLYCRQKKDRSRGFAGGPGGIGGVNGYARTCYGHVCRHHGLFRAIYREKSGSPCGGNSTGVTWQRGRVAQTTSKKKKKEKERKNENRWLLNDNILLLAPFLTYNVVVSSNMFKHT